MTWLWIIGGVIVLMALTSILPILRTFFWGFTVAMVIGLALHFQNNPGEASAAYAGMAAFFAGRRPLLRIIGL